MTTAAQECVIPYSPRPLQRVLHAALDSHRFAVAVCHRRFGKTVLAVNQLIKKALLCEKPRPRFAYLAPFRNQAKDIAWAYLKHYTAVIPGVSVNESELRIDLPNGGQIRIYGADNEDALRGIYLDGVVLDEYGQMSQTIWGEVLRPLLSDRQGWAFFIGTPNGKNQFYDIVKTSQLEPGWFFAEYRASQTHVLPEEELKSARSVITADQYMQEYECSFEASVKGAVYAREMLQALEDGRITLVPYDPALAVDTNWDLGFRDATAIWFTQSMHAGAVRVIDYYENQGHGFDHYVKVLNARPYAYGEHWLPHDIHQTEFTTGKSMLETAQQVLKPMCRVAAKLSVEDGIHAARMLLPKCYFDKTKCERGLEALKNYRWDFNSKVKDFTHLPVHDWASHGADAWRTLAVRYQAPKLKMIQKANGRDKDPDDPRSRQAGFGRGGYR